MAAFKGNDEYNLKAAVDAIMNRVQSHHTITLSKADIRSLVETEHEYICHVPFPFQVNWKAGGDLANNAAGAVRISFSLHPTKGEDTPRDPEFASKITSWVTRRTRIAYERALAKKVIDELGRRCSNVQQVRYLWPTMLLLCKHHEQLGDLAQRVQEFKQVKAPSISVGLREAMKEASAFLTMYSMVDSDNDTWPGQVAIECRHYFHFRAHDMTFDGQ